MSNYASDHLRLDDRSLALHVLIADKLSANPALLAIARDNIQRWQTVSGGTSPALVEWAAILAGPLDQISAILTSASENAKRLRQSSPFAGILTETERRAVSESFSARTYYPGGQRNFG